MWHRGPRLLPLWITLFGFGLGFGPAPVAEAAETATEAADRLTRAHEEGPRTFRREIAATRVDGWLVAEHLLLSARTPVAVAFAKAVAGDARYGRLPAYVAWRSTHPPAPTLRAHYEALTAAWSAGRDEEVLQILATMPEDEGGVLRARSVRLAAYARQRLGRPDPEVIAALRASGTALGDMGWYQPASKDLSRAFDLALGTARPAEALAIGRVALGLTPLLADPRYVWGFSLGAARAARAIGEPEEALVLVRSALPFAPSPAREREALRLLYILESQTHRQHAARRTLRRVRQLEEAAGDASALAETDVQIAMGEAVRGRLNEALVRIEDALAWIDASGTPGQRHGAHLNAASIRLHLREGGRTREHVAAARRAGKTMGLHDARLLVFEGSSWFLDGNLEKAEAAYRAALGAEPALASDWQRHVRLQLVDLLGARRRPSDAEALLAEIRSALPESASPEQRIEVESALCLLHLRAGRFAEARRAGEEARALADETTRSALMATLEARMAWASLALGEWQAAMDDAERSVLRTLGRSDDLPDELGAQVRDELGEGVTIGIEAAGRAGDAKRLFRFAEQARGVALRRHLGEGEPVLQAIEPTLRDEEEDREARQRAAMAAYRKAVAGEDAAARKQAFADLQAARTALERQRERIRARQGVAGQYLRPEVDALAVAREGLGPADVLVSFASGVETLYAVVVTRDAVRLVSVGAYRTVRAGWEAVVLDDALADTDAGVRTLRALLIDPLYLPTSGRRVWIVPTGGLGLVPFSALLPEREIVMLPSATVARLIRARADAGAARILSVAADEVALQAHLPGARLEAATIGDRRLTGKAATESALRAALAEGPWRSVHIACHGLIDPDRPLRSALSLEPSPDGDGLFSVSDVLGLSARAELVALSACSSGRGRVFAHEAAFGFAHAFFIAGARRVLVTVWDVDDTAAATFMQAFYARWSGEVDAATALQQAQADLRAQPATEHPRFWAGWQLWGAA